MNYEQYVLDVFRENESAMGQSSEEIEDNIEEATFNQIEKYLKKLGYDLLEMYRNDCCWPVKYLVFFFAYNSHITATLYI